MSEMTLSEWLAEKLGIPETVIESYIHDYEQYLRRKKWD